MSEMFENSTEQDDKMQNNNKLGMGRFHGFKVARF